MPDASATFEQSKEDMATRLITCTKQFDEILDSLPGLARTETQQFQRIAELEAQLVAIDGRRDAASKIKAQVRSEIEHVIASTSQAIMATR